MTTPPTKAKKCGRCRGNRILFGRAGIVICGRCDGTGNAPAPEDHTYSAFYEHFEFGHSFATSR